MGEPRVSVIIPCKDVNDYVRQCIEHCLKLDYRNFDIMLLPDSGTMEKFPKTKVFPTGPVKPSLKRNIAVKKTRAEVCAFIDSDAYPDKKWLKNAAGRLKGNVGIIGGPNIIPTDDNVWQRAGDDVLSSYIGAGSFALRYRPGSSRLVKELPSCNLLVRRSVFMKIGGFDTSLLTAEDAKFCFQVRGMGKEVLYSPDVVVYHHRRALFRPHLKQMWVYGRDKAGLLKGFFSRDKMLYFLPSAFVLFLILGFIASLGPWPPVGAVYVALVVLYLVVVAAASIARSARRAVLIFPGIILTHVFYGLGFLYGLLKG